MPDFDHHGPGHGHGGTPGFHGRPGWFGGPDPDLWLLLPAALIVLVVAAALLYRAGVAHELLGRLTGPSRRDEQVARWRAAVERHDTTARAFAAYECDPREVLARPALADVSRPATARFVDAFAAACALRTDDYPGERLADEFARAADAAARAWTAANDAADRTRWATFASGERTLLSQTVRLLATVEESPFAEERHTAYRRALARLGELERRTGWSLPRPAAIALQDRARGMLGAAG